MELRESDDDDDVFDVDATAACSMPQKPSCSPVSVQTYTNAEYMNTSESNDNHSTLPIRHSDSVDNAVAADFFPSVDTGQTL